MDGLTSVILLGYMGIGIIYLFKISKTVAEDNRKILALLNDIRDKIASRE